MIPASDGEYIKKLVTEPPEGEDPDPEAPKVVIRSGKGVYKLDGNEYEGDWVDDKMHGQGNFRFMGGSVYNGNFDDNKFHGQGKYIWEHGAYYIGAWENNKMHGDGMFVDSTGRQWKGKFYNGQGPGLHTLPANNPSKTVSPEPDQ